MNLNVYVISKILQVLDNIVQDKIDKDVSQANRSHEDEDDDFDPDITLDNLADEVCAKSPRRGNIHSVQLAAKMVEYYWRVFPYKHKIKFLSLSLSFLFR